MKDQSLITLIIVLAVLSVLVDSSIYIISFATDAAFIAALLWCGWRVLENERKRRPVA